MARKGTAILQKDRDSAWEKTRAELLEKRERHPREDGNMREDTGSS